VGESRRFDLAKLIARWPRLRYTLPVTDLMKRPLPQGPTIQAKPDFCPACDGRRIIKRGLRKNSLRHLQIYFCKDCGKYFSSLAGLKGVKYPPRVIARALCLYNLGHSQEETVRRIASEHRIKVPRRTVSDWISGYRSITTFHRLRAAAIQRFPSGMLKGRRLEHQQVYEFKVHLAKLALMHHAVARDVAAKVEGYLLSIFEDFPDILFQEDKTASLDQQGTPQDKPLAPPAAVRSSKSHFEILPLARIEKQNLANDLAALGLLLARKTRDRHPSIQDFMLANDSSTVACEIPVYLTAEEISYYKSKGFFVALPESKKPITGHIDVLQARNGLIHLLDYKPKAREIDPVNQLVVYALAFASRARLPVRVFKCAWFDEKDYFEFFPLQAIKAKSAAAPA
jgi:transposase-like protein